MGIKPEDVLPEDQNSGKFGGVTVRKGTIAAALENAEILESKNATEAEKNAARNMLKELAPSLVAVGLQKHLVWKNPEVQKIIEKNGNTAK